MASIRAVLFDLDHTLFDTDRAERFALKEALGRLGLPFSPAVLRTYRGINQRLWEAYQRGEVTPPVLARERFRLLLKQLRQPTSRTRRLAALYIRCMAARGDLRPGSRALLRGLSRRFLLGTVTNGIDRVARSRLRVARIHEHFDSIVTSQGCGFAKPDPRIVLHVLGRLRVDPAEAVLVGDDPQSDGAAAARAGVRFLWVDHGQSLRPGVPRPNHRIREWAELRAFLTGHGSSSRRL